jgi:hypothetical protein
MLVQRLATSTKTQNSHEDLNMTLLKYILSSLLITLSGPSCAELQLDDIKSPLVNKIQQPSDVNIEGQAVLMRFEVKPTNMTTSAEHVVKLVHTLLHGAPNLLVLGEITLYPTPWRTDPPKNQVFALKPQYTVTMAIGKSSSLESGKDSFPVQFTVLDSAAREKATLVLKYATGKDAQLKKQVVDFLVKSLNLTEAVWSVGTDVLEPPKLKVWLETEDGSPLKIGSQVAIYYQTDKNGYVSFYQFRSDRDVLRLYPNETELYNFVEAGLIYRYPSAQGDYLDIVQGPASKLAVFKAVLTIWPSNTPREQENGLRFKSDPILVIPTHDSVQFYKAKQTKFELPAHLYTETHITYKLAQ